MRSPIYFEDLEVGDRREVGSYQLEAEEIIEFARRWDPQPFHIDEAAAAASVFGGLTASSCHVFCIVTRLFHDNADFAVLAMLGKDRIRLANPARPGDCLSYQTECVEKRASRSNPDRGLIGLADTLVNQSGDVILSQKVTLMVARRTPAAMGHDRCDSREGQ